MKLQILILVGLGIILFSSVASAQTTPTPTPTPLTVTDAWADGKRHPLPLPTPGSTPDPAKSDEMFADAGLRDRIWIEVEHLVDAKVNPKELVLFINGQELKGIKAVAIDGPKRNWLGFDLQRTPESDLVWRSLLGSPTEAYRQVNVSVGATGQQAVATTVGKPQPIIYLRLYYGRWVVISIIGLILVVGYFIFLAIKGHLIHDSDPPAPPPNMLKPYSLALTQAAWWFFFVIGSFVFIYMITGDYNTITDQALILMGIGTGTALGAFMINASKRNTADTELSTLVPQRAKLNAEVQQLTAAATDPVTLAEKQAQLAVLDKKIDDAKAGLSKPVSEGFLDDILTDVNGITLHRFQMLIWTIVLGIIFAIGVYRNLAMPTFNATLLALMGISAVTYLGFKIPERQN
jgi:hypothetical protein